MAFDQTKAFEVENGIQIAGGVGIFSGTGSPLGSDAPTGSSYKQSNGTEWIKTGPGVNDWEVPAGIQFDKIVTHMSDNLSDIVTNAAALVAVDNSGSVVYAFRPKLGQITIGNDGKVVFQL